MADCTVLSAKAPNLLTPPDTDLSCLPAKLSRKLRVNRTEFLEQAIRPAGARWGKTSSRFWKATSGVLWRPGHKRVMPSRTARCGFEHFPLLHALRGAVLALAQEELCVLWSSATKVSRYSGSGRLASRVISVYYELGRQGWLCVPAAAFVARIKAGEKRSSRWGSSGPVF